MSGNVLAHVLVPVGNRQHAEIDHQHSDCVKFLFYIIAGFMGTSN